MTTTNSTNQETLNLKTYYKELGQLLYAVAYSDGKVRQQEVDALREFVVKELLPLEHSSDSSGMNKVFYTQFEFDDYAKNGLPYQLVFMNFLAYLKANANYITESHKSLIIAAVEKVAASYKNVNKKEEELIETLKMELSKL